MSEVGYHKAQLTNALNELRRKIADTDKNITDQLDPGTDAQAIAERKQCLLAMSMSIDRAVSFLKNCWVLAQEFAMEHPDEQGELPLLETLQSHWVTSGMGRAIEDAQALLDRLDVALKLLPPSEVNSYITPCVYDASSVVGSLSFHSSLTSPLALSQQDSGLTHRPMLDTPVSGSTHPEGIEDSPSGPSTSTSFDPLVPASTVETRQQLQPGNIVSPTNSYNTDLLSSINGNLNIRDPSNTEQHFKLPALVLPVFSGEVDAFPAFWDLFSATVHDNVSVPKAIKFLYLKICLKGDAANLIANFKPIAENYEDAVRIILNTYNRPEIIRNRLWDSLVDMSTSSESVIDQRSKLCSIKAIWSQMKSLKEDSGSTGTIKTIITKFPKRTREKIGELKKREDPVWTVDDLLSALDTVVGQLELIEDTDPAKDPPSSIASSSHTSSQSPPKSSDRTRVNSGSSSEERRSRTHSPRNLRSSRTPVRQRYRSPADPSCILCPYQEYPTEVQALREHMDMDPELRSCWKRKDVIQHHTPRTRFHESRSSCRNEYSSRRAHQHLSRELSRESRHRYWSGRSQSYSPESSYRQTRGLSYPRRAKLTEHHRNPPLTTQSSACPTRPCKITASSRNTDSLPPKNTPRLMVIYVPTVSCKTGTERLLAVLLDSGAQFSFIRKSLALELGLPFYYSKNITTITFGGRHFSGITSLVDLILVDKYDEPVLFQLWTIDTITTVPRLGDYNEPSAPTEGGRIEIDVLLGIDHYWQVIDPRNNYRLPSGFILSNTRFGSILSGSGKPTKERSSLTVASVCDISTGVDPSGTEESVRSLLGLDMVALENPNDVTANEHHNSIIEHYQEFREILDHFWNLWHKEYLALLAERNAVTSKSRQYARKSPKVGDVVIIRQENIPRSNWPLGLILQLNTSKDGMSRSARIRTGKKTIVERSIKHLVPLEITAEDVSSINQSKRSLTPTRVQPPRAVKRSLSA